MHLTRLVSSTLTLRGGGAASAGPHSAPTRGSALLAVVLALAGCGTNATCPTSNTLSYDSFGKAFVTSYCISCHTTGNASEGVNLSSLTLVRTHLNKVESEVASGAMPPKGSTTPTADEKANLAQWLACGAP